MIRRTPKPRTRFPKGDRVLSGTYNKTMRIELLQRLTVVSSYIFEEITQEKTELDIAKDFWTYLRSRLLDDMT